MAKALKIEEEVKNIRTILLSELLPKITEISRRKPILIHSLHHPAMRLKEPLAVHLDYDKKQVIAFCYELDIFGYGDTEGEAVGENQQQEAPGQTEASKPKRGGKGWKIPED